MQGVGHKNVLCIVVPFNPAMLNYLLSILWQTIRLPMVSYAYIPTYIMVSALPTYLRIYNM